jgi:hypothetical protein
MALEAKSPQELEMTVTQPHSLAPVPLARIVTDVVKTIQAQGSLTQMSTAPPPAALDHTPLLPRLSATSESTISRAGKSRVLALADGKELHYNSHDVPDPPVVNFTGDLDKLARMWDDDSPEWNHSSPLTIKSVPIALKHWRNVYTHHRGSQTWTGIKQSWHSWKVHRDRITISFADKNPPVSHV